MTTTPQALLADAQTAIRNGVRHVTNKGALTSFGNATGYIKEALTLINAPAAPQPTGVSGNWELVFNEEYAGNAPDIAYWDLHDNWHDQNNVTDSAANIAVANSECSLILASATSGAACQTFAYYLKVGGVFQVRARFGGNWAAIWTSGQTGEIDVCELLDGKPTTTYHDYVTGNATTSYIIPELDTTEFHDYTCERTATEANIVVDGALVKTWSLPATDTAPHALRLTIGVGEGNPTVLGEAGALVVDSVRAWRPIP
jgi:hypothetical protein